MFLEISSLPQALERLTEEKIRVLKEPCQARLNSSTPRTIWTAWDANVRFHIALNACAENAQVTAALRRALGVFTRAYAQAYQNQPQTIAPTSKEILHDKIICALERRELYTAQGCLREDILLMEQTLLQVRGPQKTMWYVKK